MLPELVSTQIVARPYQTNPDVTGPQMIDLEAIASGYGGEQREQLYPEEGGLGEGELAVQGAPFKGTGE